MFYNSNMHLCVSNFLATHYSIIKEIESKGEIEKMFFMGDVSHILEKYNKFLIYQYNMFFTDELKLNSKKINEYIKQYIDIVNKYIPNKFETEQESNQTSTKELKCEKCNGNMYNMNDGFNECYTCGYITENFENKYVSEYYHTDNINVNRKTLYKESQHFIELLGQYHGQLKKPLSNEVLAFIESEIIMRFGNQNKVLLSVNDIKHTLKLIKLPNGNKYYNYIPYIYHKITGKPLMNVNHISESLVNDFHKLLHVWEKYVKPTQANRKSFLSNHYILYQLLCKHGYKDETKHIILLKSKEKLKDHDILYGKMCEFLQWRPVVPLGGADAPPNPPS